MLSSGGGTTRDEELDIRSEAAVLPDRVERVYGRLKECVIFFLTHIGSMQQANV